MLFVKAPLHVLRKTKAFQSLLMSRFNNPKLYDLGYNHQVALKPFTHASIRWRKQQLEPGISKLVKNIAKELDLQNDRGFFLMSVQMSDFIPGKLAKSVRTDRF
jgi:hypothetical protein